MEAIQSYCTGESHRYADKPRQDCSKAESTDLFTIGVVCDGHGGERYFRSDVGARAAVDAARKGAEEFVRNADESLFRDAQFTQRGTADAEAEKKKSCGSDVRDALFRQLFASIIYDWREHVVSHANHNPVPLSENEKRVPPEYIEEFNKTDADGNRTGIEKTYGCTLICFVQTKSYWFAFHIGDGKCISFSADKDSHISWEEPVPEDRECFLNTTTSICDANAINEFRYCYGGRNTFPLAVFLASDGIDDSFGEDSNLANFYVQILKKIVRSSPDEVKSELDSTLLELGVHGSKDDKSVVCCFDGERLKPVDEERLKPVLNGLVEWQCENVQRAIDELKKGGTESSDSLERKKLEFKLTKLRSELEDPSDYLKLARLYENGTGVSQNDSEALEWYRKAAEKGNAEAQLELGKRYFDGRSVSVNASEAVEWYRKAADKGNTEAQLELGDRYFEGRGVEQKYSTAAEWYRKAAEQGIARAQYQLGLMYSQGQGVERNYVEAAEWYRKAAEQGSKEAQRSLAGLFEYGKGVGQSYAEAEKWYQKAADQGSKEAQYSLGLIYAYGKGGVQSNTEAFRWFHKAAEQGYAFALYRLGSMYEYGTGIPQDDETALDLYQEAAKKGNRWAQRHLGYLYSRGIGAEQDLQKAMYWLSEAAKKGDSAAQSSLGEMYYAEADYVKAREWFRKAADQGNAQAQYRLGKIYSKGLGVMPDPNLAFMWYSRAAENGHSKALDAIDDKLLIAVKGKKGKKGGSAPLKFLSWLKA